VAAVHFPVQSGCLRGRLSDEIAAERGCLKRWGAQAPANQPNVRQSSLAGSVTIVPDELHQLITHSGLRERDYDVIKEAVDQLDIRPLQVLIEVLIVEARQDRSFSFGTSFFVQSNRSAAGTTQLAGAGSVRGRRSRHSS